MNQRLEMFSDGVFAIAITLLILEIKVPSIESVHSTTDLWNAVARLWPSLFALSLSFIIILISWVGHQYVLNCLDKTSNKFQYANGYFLFTVIILPFPTALMAEYLNTPYAQPAVVLYCLSGLLHNTGWNLLHRYILRPKPLVKDSINIEKMRKLAKGSNRGFFISLGIVILAWWLPYLAIILSLILWLYWLFLTASAKHTELQVR